MPPHPNPTQPARQRPAIRSELFDLTPTDEQRLLVESVREFALARLRPAAPAADAACGAPPELLDAIGELGIAALGVPEAFGGVLDERAAVSGVLVAEALAEGDMGIALAALAPAGVATALGLWGNAEQQSAHLAAFASATPPAAAVAVAEPQPVFDPADLRTVVTRDGADFLLSGVKSLVPRAAECALVLVAAALDGAPALFLVDGSSSGLTAEPEPAMGIRAAATGRLTLDRVRVPAGALLADGEPAVYRELTALARIGWSALAVGTGQAVLDYVGAYVNDRVAFGEPISNRQAVAFTVANIAIELDGLRLATHRAAALAETGAEFTQEAALARSVATRHAMQIGSDGIQLLGGHGYTKEHPVERWYRDLRAAGMLEGVVVV